MIGQAVRSSLVTVRARLALPEETATMFVFNCLSIFLTMAASIPVARILGPTQKGVLNLFSLLTGLLAEFGLFGVNSGLTYYLANRRTPLTRVHTAAIQASVILGSVCLAVVLVFRPVFDRAFEGLPVRFIWISSAIAPLLLYRALWGSLVTAINRAVHAYRVNFIFSVLGLAGLLLLWSGGWMTAINIIWLNILLLGGYCAYGFHYLFEAHNRHFEREGSCLWGALKYGSVVHLGAILNWLHFRVDQVMINYLQGPRGVGIYTVSVAAAEMLWLIDYAVINAALFKISSLEVGESWGYTWRTFKSTGLLLVGGGILLGGAAPWLVVILYGAQFQEAILPLVLLIPGVIGWGASRVLSQFISYNAGKPYLTSGAALIGCVLNIVGNLYSIPRWGIAGAAVASSGSYLTTLLVLGAIFGLMGRRLGAVRWR
jgi:O-antigen/teichoic acid export membrane protein